MQSKIMGQKFLVAAFILLVTTVGLFLGKISESGWEIVSLGTLGGFGGLNLVAKMFRPVAGGASEDDELEPPVGPTTPGGR